MYNTNWVSTSHGQGHEEDGDGECPLGDVVGDLGAPVLVQESLLGARHDGWLLTVDNSTQSATLTL